MILGVIIQVSTQATPHALAQFIVGRVITGIGNGINTSTIPTYQGEKKITYAHTPRIREDQKHLQFVPLG